LRYANYLTVVVDNGSVNDSLTRLRAWGKEHFREPGVFVEYCRDAAQSGGEVASEARLEQPASNQRLLLISSEENLGFNGGCNLVFRYALLRPQPAEYVFLLNNDAFPDPDCLAHLIAASQKSKAGILGAVNKHPETGEISTGACRGSVPLLREFFWPLITWRPVLPDPEKEFESCLFALGPARLIRTDVLEALHRSTGHYLDEAAFIYGDEVEFSARARNNGFGTVIANRALVFHGRAASSGGLYNPIVNYYPTRNQVRQARHMLPWYLRPPFHALHISWSTARAAKNLLKGRRRSALAIFRGLIDGYLGVTGKWQRHDAEVLLWRKTGNCK
jgi:GT2 family glycosyltransferase